MATLNGDEEVAAALEASARRAQLRAGHASAVTAFLRAAELSTDDAHRVRRVAAAAHAAWDAGQVGRAREIIGQALPQATGQTRAQLLHLGGRIERIAGEGQEAFTLLVGAADACTDPSLTIELLFQAADAAVSGGDPAPVAELSQRAIRISPVDQRDRFKIAALGGFARFYAGDHSKGQALLADALDSADTVTESAGAADRLFRLTTPGRADINSALALEAMSDAIEAAIRAGRPQEAGQRLEHLRAGVAAVPTPTRRALLARCEALETRMLAGLAPLGGDAS
jgi:hypothetical protein